LRYQTTPAFDRDLGCLRAREKELFTQSVRETLIPSLSRSSWNFDGDPGLTIKP